MLTKEELVNTYIKYSSDITEEIFNKIIDKLESLGFEKSSDYPRKEEYKSFIDDFPYLKIIYSTYWIVGFFEADYKEIQVSDILGEESKFEVGKWYEIISTNYEPGEHISKFLKLKDGNFYYSEAIRFGNYSKHSDQHGHANWVREVSLEEIQQYLPEGHVDKIVKEFVLPRKWCVKFDKNNWKTLADWANFDWYKEYKTDHTYYLTVNKTHFGILSNDYTEITFEQFKQYVLKESVKKEVKPVEKWSVGSYVVFCKDEIQCNGFLKGQFTQILRSTNNGNFYTIGYEVTSNHTNLEGIEWFATLPEAEAFSKSLLEPKEPKPLSVDDLVEGEIYLIEYPSGNQFINLSNGKDDVKCYIDIRNKEYHKSSTCGGAINCTIASPEEKKWLLTCIKQDEFISPDQLDMYDSEGNLIEDKPKFKIGDWVVVIPSNNPFHNYKKAIGHIFPIRDDSAYYQNFIKGNTSAIDPNNTYGINYRLEDVRLATPEEIAKVTKPKPKTFKYNKWYKRIEFECSKILIFVYENGYYENGYYGFNLDGKWFNSSHFDYSEFDKERLIPATIEEVKERLLSYAKEKYPIGTKFKCITYDKEFTVTNPNYMDNASGFTPNDDSTIWIGVKEQCSGRIFGNKGKWAEVISKPESKESKEFDRNWYVEINSQEEADKVFEYLESVGEVTTPNTRSNRKYLPNSGYKYIYYLTGKKQWFLGDNPGNYPQKQLSDILPECKQPIKIGSGLKEQIAPNYSKINRNVYYEVSNQEEYEEILDWLKSMGEEVCSGSIVTKDWKYIYRDNNWCLDKVKPDLPKAEFSFKSKQSIKVDTYFEEACPFPSLKGFIVDLSDVTISEQVIRPTIVETPTNEKEIISKKKKSIEF